MEQWFLGRHTHRSQWLETFEIYTRMRENGIIEASSGYSSVLNYIESALPVPVLLFLLDR